MTLFEVLQLCVFLVLMFNSVHLVSAFGRGLRDLSSLIQPGFHFAILGLRLVRNGIGLVLIPASAAPNPEVHALVPGGIAVFVVLAVLNALLTQYQQRVIAAWSGQRCSFD